MQRKGNMKYFTNGAKKVLNVATDLSMGSARKYVGTEHILLALLKVKCVAKEVLERHVDMSVCQELIYNLINEDVGIIENNEVCDFSLKAKEILESARTIALKQNLENVGTIHLLLALIRAEDCIAVRVLNTLGINIARLHADALVECGFTFEEIKKEAANFKRNTSGSPMLEQYTKDLTLLAKKGKLDPVIGRSEEITRIIRVLCRRTKNNPCLVGEPGVGKTAIVEGLASLIAEGAVPDLIKNTRILALDLSGMVAGTKYRGEFEERIKRLMAEVKANSEVVLFMDEIHTIIGAGGSEGSLDAANILKPALSRGEIRIIGATTRDEYRKHIEKDAALERRFQPVTVEEPGEKECIDILFGLKESYEEFHRVSISDEALVQAVKLTSRYVTDRFLPDKALDCLDEACSKAKLKTYKITPEALKMESRLSEINELKENAISNYDIEAIEQLKKEEEALLKRLGKFGKKSGKKKDAVDSEMIADIISSWTKVPLSKLNESENERLLKLEKTLHNRVIGQEEAISSVSKAIRRGRIGIKDPNRPIGSFLFLGPTGVGKTELSKALAEAMFGNEAAIIRVDMSEYMEKHSVAKMIGSPPGYIGHDDGGQLSEQVRQKPYSIVLFDEIEKAHPDVFNVLLQVLDEGHITDSQGRKVNFKNTVIIMTSNAGAQSIISPKKLGFNNKNDAKADYEHMKNNVMEEVKRLFKPEFLNRIDDIVVFHQLSTDELREIVKLMVKGLKKRIEDNWNIKLTISKDVLDFIAEKGNNPKYGARPIKRAIQDYIEDVLADEILSGSLKQGMEVKLKIKDDKVVVIK